MGQLLSRFRQAAVAPRPPEKTSEGPPHPAASKPRDGDEGSARRRIAYSREFLISVGTSCTSLPAGFDASKLSELSQLVETGSSRAPLGRWRDAQSKWNQLDRHHGNQCRQNWQWQRKEPDGLLGSGASPKSSYYVGPLASDGQGSGCQLTTRKAGGYQPTWQYKAPPVSQKTVDSINTEMFGSFQNWNKDRVEEERQRRASFELMRIISSLHDSAGKRDPPTKSVKQGGLKVPFLSKEDAIKTAPLPPTPTTTPHKQLGFTNGLPQKRLPIKSFNTSHNSEYLTPQIQLLTTGDVMVSNAPESSISAQRFSGGGILEWERAEGLRANDETPDINSRFQSLDVSGPHFHDQIDPNNLYHLFETRPNEESPKRNAGAMFLPSWQSDRNRHAPFDMPKATHHGAYYQFPQDMKSMQGVGSAPGGPCAGPAAPHHILPHMTMPRSSLPPQGFPICAPHMFYCRTEMSGTNSFQMRRCQPGYGETGMMMEGPEGEVNQAGTFDRPVQMDVRGRSRQMHPELAGPVHGHFRR
ncbi:unnamed protein product [Alopecurus aequalis]